MKIFKITSNKFKFLIKPFLFVFVLFIMLAQYKSSYASANGINDWKMNIENNGVYSGVYNEVYSEVYQLEEKIKLQKYFVNVKEFGAKGDGITNDMPAFQAAIDSLPSTGGTIYIDGSNGETYCFDFNSNSNSAPTINSPTRVLINKDNVQIIGFSSPTIKMTGLTLSYLNSIKDKNSSGRDIFTCFSFMRSKKSSISGVNFVGEWDGTGELTYTSPRAKAVGFIGTTDCYAKDLKGENLFGNLVNATPSDYGIDGVYKPCNGLYVEGCLAVQSLENGINFMGNTFNMQITNCRMYNCTTGFESATENFTATNCIINGSKKCGFSLSGKKQAVSNIISSDSNGMGIMVTAGDIIKINNCIVKGSSKFALQCYPGVKNLTVDNCEFTDNNKINNGQQYAALYFNGTVAKNISDLSLVNNKIVDLSGNIIYGIMLSNLSNGYVSGNNWSVTSATYGLYASQSTSNIIFSLNNGNKPALSQGNNKDYTPKLIIQQNAIPTSGTWKAGDEVISSSPQIRGTSPNKYIIYGWKRITTGSNNVLNIDWVEMSSLIIE